MSIKEIASPLSEIALYNQYSNIIFEITSIDGKSIKGKALCIDIAGRQVNMVMVGRFQADINYSFSVKEVSTGGTIIIGASYDGLDKNAIIFNIGSSSKYLTLGRNYRGFDNSITFYYQT